MNTLKFFTLYMLFIIGITYAQCPRSGEAEVIRNAPGFKHDRHCGEYIKLDGKLALAYAKQKLASNEAIILKKGSSVGVIGWETWDGDTLDGQEYPKIINTSGEVYYTASRHLTKKQEVNKKLTPRSNPKPATKHNFKAGQIVFFVKNPLVYSNKNDLLDILNVESIIEKHKKSPYPDVRKKCLDVSIELEDSRRLNESNNAYLKGSLVEIIECSNENDIIKINVYGAAEMYTKSAYLRQFNVIYAMAYESPISIYNDRQALSSALKRIINLKGESAEIEREKIIKDMGKYKIATVDIDVAFRVLSLNKGIAKVRLDSGIEGYCLSSVIKVNVL